MTKLKEVADAIEAKLEAWPEMSRATIEVLARAAIEAMREPTEEMEDAADSLNPGSGLPYEPGSPRQVWQAMIDAALKDPT